jgi:hypothetical protein
VYRHIRVNTYVCTWICNRSAFFPFLGPVLAPAAPPVEELRRQMS